VPPVQLPNQRGNHPPIRGTLRVGHIDKTTSDRGRVLSMLLLEPLLASLQAFAASLSAWRTHLWVEVQIAPRRPYRPVNPLDHRGVREADAHLLK
jgi:hypothetical protein